MNTNQNTKSTGPKPNQNSNAGCGAIALLTLLCLLAAPAPATAQSGIPAAINYQGKLTDNLGNPVASGYYEVSFRIWDHPTQAATGNYLWGRTFPLNVVTNGMFNVLLTDDGSQFNSPATPKVASLLQAFEGADRYLGLAVSRNPAGQVTTPVEISPRQQLVTAPFAIHAYSASLADYAGFATNAAYAYAAASGSAGSQFNASSGLQVTGQTTLNGNLNVQASTTTGGGFVPVGGIIMWSGTTAPAGWALCDGSTVNGNLTPDLRGRFVLGQSPTYIAGTSGGSAMHTNTVPEMATHTHAFNVWTVGYSASWAGNSSATAAPDHYQDKNNGTQSDTIEYAGSSTPYSTMPPYWVLAYIMRVQ